ncbi:hypothetical protein DFA_04174 [Cavenderia fasciculata]|uniref:Ankyrin repeat-containing protein n=1 Tax=Cavenderia fasciculata TaxID=261658 RepID=F4Q1H7_CACFS|nr:uncharacterized protein DFA_04174 [Cavenderia fasciculata]EGG18678.1 hypothetical protein DFA_04174 [Cavenderia fasciculata]|eukprot:XP_004366582.1 hypothetical protein DFA_04174 [Cavenderia fasciculata]
MFNIFKLQYIRYVIFKQLKEQLEREKNIKPSILRLQGKDIVNLSWLGMISKYAMPWDFIKHYLPPLDQSSWLRRLDVITKYCCHPNATLDTFKHLLEWSKDYDITKGIHINAGSMVLKSSPRNISSISNRDILEYLIDHYPNISLDGIADNAAKFGNLPIIELLNSSVIGRKHLNQSNVIDIAEKNGHFHIIGYLNNQPIIEHQQLTLSLEESKSSIINNRKEHLEKEFYANRKVPTKNYRTIIYPDEMDMFARLGYFDNVKDLHENSLKGIEVYCTTNAINWSSMNGHLNIVKYLNENRLEGCTTDAMDNASSNGHLDIVKYLHLNRTEGCTTRAMENAIINGDLIMFVYLLENRTEGRSSRSPPRFKPYEPPSSSSTLYQAKDIFSILLQYNMIDITQINSDYIKQLYFQGLYELVDLCNSLLKINTKIENEISIKILSFTTIK